MHESKFCILFHSSVGLFLCQFSMIFVIMALLCGLISGRSSPSFLRCTYLYVAIGFHINFKVNLNSSKKIQLKFFWEIPYRIKLYLTLPCMLPGKGKKGKRTV